MIARINFGCIVLFRVSVSIYIIRQNKFFVERYSKQSQGWTYSDLDSLDQLIALESINVELAIAEIYRGIEF